MKRRCWNENEEKENYNWKRGNTTPHIHSNTVIGQYHTKLVVVQTAGETYISNGAANLTDRALNNYNLESNLRIIAPNDSELVQDINAYFTRLWKNEDAQYTVDYENYQDDFTFFQRSIIWLQKLFKLTTY